MKVRLDIGGSAVRSKIKDREVQSIPSQYKVIDPQSRIPRDISEPNTDITILKSPLVELEGKRIARGEAALHNQGTFGQIDNQGLKVAQTSFYVNFAYTIAENMLRHNLYKDNPQVGITIPTGEFYDDTAVATLRSSVEGTWQIHFMIPDKTVTFTIHHDSLRIYPEGVVAIAPLRGTPQYKEMIATKIGAIIDPGRRSTDMSLYVRGKVHGSSAQSFPTGGILLESLVKNELTKLGYFVTDEEVSSVISTGYVTNGKNKVAVGIAVQNAKKSLAGLIKQGLVQVLSSAGLFINNLGYIVIMGRCFDVVGKQGDDFYTGSLLSYLLEEIPVEVDVIKFKNNETANIEGIDFSEARREAKSN